MNLISILFVFFNILVRFGVHNRVVQKNLVTELPDNFDSRLAWPQCCSVIDQVIDQSACDSGWAISVADAISDRICIATNRLVHVSAFNLMQCVPSYERDGKVWQRNNVCDNGTPIEAWKYFEEHGLVTGGPYGSQTGCKPYPFNASMPTFDPTFKCKPKCDNPEYETSFTDDLYHGFGYQQLKSIEEIQREIYLNGPVVAMMDLYDSFYYLNDSRIYQRGPQDLERQTVSAVRLIGWGTDGTETTKQQYWIGMNSFGPNWASNGTFKALKGVNECNIEAMVSVSMPIV